MKKYETLLTESHDSAVLVSIHRPDAMNALNATVFDELKDFFETGYSAFKTHVIILTGSGEKAFAAGADIKELHGLSPDAAEQLSRKGQMIFSLIEQFHMPVIAAVNGFALGGGCELAMACHLRVASNKARFGQPEVNLGILPGYGGTQRLIQLVGKGKAMELLLTGDMIGAEEAHRLGLVNHLTEPDALLGKCFELADKMASKGPLALQAVIRATNAYFTPGKDGYHEEASLFGQTAGTKDFEEGTLAFIEKRKPVFSGK